MPSRLLNSSVRPPPLQLKLDNRFPLYAQEEQSKSFFEKLYCANWRNIVLAACGINILRFLLSSLNAYHDTNVDNEHFFTKLASASMMLCTLYIVPVIIDAFGILSVSMRNVFFLRLYTCFAIFVAFVTVVASTIAALTFIILADDVVRECITLASTGQLASKSLFRGRPWPLTQQSLSNKEAGRACLAGWSNEMPAQIISIFIFSLLPSIVYCLLVYTYYRQVNDPTHAAYLGDNRDSAIRMEEYVYSPVNNRIPQSSTRLAGRATNSPQIGGTATRKTKATRNTNKRAAPPMLSVMESASPLQYMLTPGPPSFGPSRTQVYDGKIESGNSLKL